jgi:hypothetical protein
MTKNLPVTLCLFLASALIGCGSPSSGGGGGTGSFSLAPSASTLPVTQGASVTDTVLITELSPFSGSVALSASGLPAGTTATFGTNPAVSSSVVTFAVGSSTAAGPATATITGTSGALTASTTINLTVNQAGGFTLVPSASSISIVPGASYNDAISVTDISPFIGSVSLAASGLPDGTTATFGTNPASGSSIVTFAASGSATAGTSSVTITGTSGPLTASATIALTIGTPGTAFSGPFTWSSSGPLISAVSPMVAVKDPSAVYYDNQWIVYATSVDASGDYNMEYRHFTDWSEAGTAEPYYLNSSSNFNGYHTAPQVFYFTPQKTWYLIYQSPQPQFSTNSDPTQPQNWTPPQNLLNEPAGSSWLDYWVICDSANCSLFFTGDNGDFYRSSTTIQNFPNGFSAPVIVLSDPNPGNLFEADNVYKIAGMNLYLADIECIGPTGNRFFRAFTAPSLDGSWTPVTDAETSAMPFLGLNNVSFAAGVTPWTNDFSSGGLLPSYDETDQVDPNHLQFLFQGDNTANYPSGTPYGGIPWQLGLATQTSK